MLAKFFVSLGNKANRLNPWSDESNINIRAPAWLRFPSLKHFNFIILHYLYMVSMTLIGSVIIYGGGNMPYIDALFFASGSATQSGLNTIDINNVYLYQQITFAIMASVCNPIFINTFIVFVRLYWFEKRFQGVVTKAKTTRGRTMSRRKTEEKNEPDFDREEQGVGDRRISVFTNPEEANGKLANGKIANGKGKETEGSSTESDPDAIHHASQDFANLSPTESGKPRREIMFADELKNTDGANDEVKDEKVQSDPDIANEDRVPAQRSKEQHIAFVENQRKPKDDSTLWIPGPRDMERGFRPQRIEEGESSDRDSDDIQRGTTPGVEFDLGEHPNEKKEKPSGYFRFRGHHNDEANEGLRRRVVSRTRSFGTHFSQDRREVEPLPYLSYSATIGRNSTFVDLTEDEREELGGIEYRALKTLAWVLICYQVGFFVLSWIILVPWVVRSRHYSGVLRNFGQSPTWWGIFSGTSLFTDLGLTITPDSMISFNESVVLLLLGTFLIIIGNTGFPCMLRFVIWTASKCVPFGSGIWEEFRFLLDHPRRCFTLLFPRKATWWLFGILVILNGLDLIFFVLLDLKDETVTNLPAAFQFLDGLFQAASTRTAGFSVVNLAELHPGIQVSYLIMMYISVFPIAMAIRNTNVYEENSLGIYATGGDEDSNADPNSTSYIGTHLRRQLSFDLWYVFLGLFLIAIIEGSRIENVNQPAFTMYSCLFELVSAYGTVGLSLGYPDTNASFSAQFHTLSKLIIIAMEIRGRHRGLPYSLDRAILLPSDSLQRKDAAIDERRRERRASLSSTRRATNWTDEDGPRLQDFEAPTVDRKHTVGHGLKRIVTGALSAGPSGKHHLH